ncbi:MAG: RHS repeat-associated core domain-containing protein [Oscillospiraceae bacterium]|nr:RHS repeat-associated core domain-containing protein [Oscillospiraceae bacterium]
MRSYYDSTITGYDTFHYVLNAQGDVVQLKYQSRQDRVYAQYTYDAWGNVLTKSGNYADLNPLRYRGYYYDTETGFYYLQSRYYDPIVKRFINADSYGSTGTGLLGYNMFAYCENNPVNSVDQAGHRPLNVNTMMTDSGGGFTPPPVPYVSICSADEDGKGGLRALSAAEQNCCNPMYCGVTASLIVTKDELYEVKWYENALKSLAESLLINQACKAVRNKVGKWAALKCFNRGLTASSSAVKFLDKLGGVSAFFLEWGIAFGLQSLDTPTGKYNTIKVVESGYYRTFESTGTPAWQYYEHTIYVWNKQIGAVPNYIVLNETMYYGERRH